MTFIVPFDGTTLAEAALVRAFEYGNATGEEVVAVTVISERKRYAREKGWIDKDEPLDTDRIVDDLRQRVETLTPDATFEYEVIREFPPAEGIADRIKRLALDHDPSVLFLGTENLGRVVTPLSSVGTYVAAEDAYDVYLVRQVRPPELDFLDPHPEFYETVDTERAEWR